MRTAQLATFGAALVMVGGVWGAAAPSANAAVVLAEVDPPETESGNCGLNMSCRIREGVSGWIAETLAETINLGLMASGDLIAIPDLSAAVRETWGVILTITNSLFVLFVVVAGVLVMTHQTAHTHYGIRDAIPRITLGWIGANASWVICDNAIIITNALSTRILGESATPEIVTDTILRYTEDFVGEAIAWALMVWFAVILAILLAFILLIRLVLVALVVIASPLAIACHALPGLDGLARLWWRGFAGLLLIQIAQSLVLMSAARLFLSREGNEVFATSWVAADIALVIGLLYICVRIPFWVFKRIFNYQGGPVSRAAKVLVSYLVFRNVGKSLMKGSGKRGAKAAVKSKGRSGAVASRARRPSRQSWHQPPLPGMPQGHQPTLPGIDRQIDVAAQRRAYRRRQATRSAAGYDAPQNSVTPRAPAVPRYHQDAIPGLRVPQQGALFPVTEEMRRPLRSPAHPRASPPSRPVRPRPRRRSGGGRR